jgi:cell division septation protein DedD
MNSYRTRTPNISGIAVVLVVLLSIGAIVVSIVLGPKPNTTVVNLQPIRPAQTTPVPTAASQASANQPSTNQPSTNQPSVNQPSADAVANIPPEELPVIESRPTQAVQNQVPGQDQVIEQSELGTEPSLAATPTDTNASSSQASATNTAPSASSSVAALGDSASNAQIAATPNTTAPRETTSTPARTTSAQPRAATSATTATTGTSSTPATPSAFLRRNTNGVSVQVGAFRSVDSAAKLAQELARKGFTASVQPSGGLYRVVIGPYKDDATARAAAARAR